MPSMFALIFLVSSIISLFEQFYNLTMIIIIVDLLSFVNRLLSFVIDCNRCGCLRRSAPRLETKNDKNGSLYATIWTSRGELVNGCDLINDVSIDFGTAKGRLPTETSDSELASDMEPIKPTIYQPLRDATVSEGDKVRLDCVIVAQPEPEVTGTALPCCRHRLTVIDMFRWFGTITSGPLRNRPISSWCSKGIDARWSFVRCSRRTVGFTKWSPLTQPAKLAAKQLFKSHVSYIHQILLNPNGDFSCRLCPIWVFIKCCFYDWLAGVYN